MQCSYACKNDGTNAGKNVNQQSNAQLEHFEELERTGVSPLESHHAYREFLQIRLDALNLKGFTLTDHVRFCRMMHGKVKPETSGYGAWCRARRVWEAKRDERIEQLTPPIKKPPPESIIEPSKLEQVEANYKEARSKLQDEYYLAGHACSPCEIDLLPGVVPFKMYDYQQAVYDEMRKQFAQPLSIKPPTSATEINTVQDAFDKTWEPRAKEFAKIFTTQPKKEETQMITVSTVTIATETAEKLQEKRMKHVVASLQADLEKDGCAHDNGQGLTVIQAEAIRVGFRKAGFIVTHGTGDKSTSTYIRVTFDTTGGV